MTHEYANTAVISAWARHCEISYYVAAHDIDVMIAAMGEFYTMQFITLKMSGDETTSLNQFCKENELTVNWTEYL